MPLYYVADDGTHGLQLWETTGTANGSVMLTTANSTSTSGGDAAGFDVSGITSLTTYGGKLFFVADDGTHGLQLWDTDGTQAGTIMLTNVHSTALPGSDAIGFGAKGITSPIGVGGRLYFVGDDGTDGTQLWESDGTAAGTLMLTHANSTSSSGGDATGFGAQGITRLTASDGKLYFIGDDGTHGTQLWVADGTASGTVMLTDANATSYTGGDATGFGAQGIANLTTVDGKLYFVGNDGTHGTQLWVSDGTSAGTIMLTHANSTSYTGGDAIGFGAQGIRTLTALGDTLYFVGDDGVHGAQLWISNGTAATTIMLTHANSTSSSGGDATGFGAQGITRLSIIGGKLFFVGDDGTHGTQLWESDGTAAGTFMLTDVNSTSSTGGDASFGAQGIASLTTVNSKLYFIGNDGTHGAQLWATDGTTAGTLMLTNVNSTLSTGGDATGFGAQGITSLTTVDGKLYFVGNDGTHGTQLWVSGGGVATTVMLTDVNSTSYTGGDAAGFGVQGITNLVGYNGKLYFVGDDGTHGTQLWDSDGTTAGTVMLTSANSTASSGSDAVGFGVHGITSLTAAGGKLYFVGNDGVHGLQLWATDGTAGGTFMVTDSPGFTSSGIQSAIPSKREVAANFEHHAVSDVLMEDTTGALVAGEVGSGGKLSYGQIGGLGAEWSFKEVGDYYGDGKSQFLIENTSGAVDLGEIGASGQASYVEVSALGSTWSFVGSGDFLGLGKDEYLIEGTNGAVVVGTVAGSDKTSYLQVSTIGSEWKFVGSGDFYGDDKSQFLLENTNGAVDVGEVALNGQAAYTQVSGLGSTWSFVGVGDFLGDGKDQFLIEGANGALDVGEVQANSTVNYTGVGQLGSEWKFVGVGDYTGTGVSSFLIESTSGAVVTGTIVGGQAQFVQIGGLGSQWSFRG